MLGGGFAVAGQNDGAQALAVQFLHNVTGLRADVVAQDKPSEQGALGEPDFREAGVGRRHLGDGRGVRALGQPFAAAQQANIPIAPGAQALAGDGLEVGEFQRLQALLFAVAGDGARQRMGRKAFEGEGKLRHFRLAARREALDGLDAQFARGERAGLVEGNGVDGGQFLDGGAAAEENAVAGAPGNRRQHGGRDREHQRARGGHHQQRHGVIKGAVPEVPGSEGRLAETAATRRRTSRGRAPARCRCNSVPNRSVNCCAGAFRCWASLIKWMIFCKELSATGRSTSTSTAPQRLMVPGEDAVANGLRDGRDFAGEVGFVAGGLAFDDLGIHRELGAGLDQQPHAGAQLLHLHLALMALGVKHRGGLGSLAEERPNLPLRAAQRKALQRAGKGKQEQQRRAFAPGADAGAAQSDRQHEEVDVNGALAAAAPKRPAR